MLSVINKKIEVLTQQTEDGFEMLNSPYNRPSVGEEQQQLDNRSYPHGLRGIEIRQRNLKKKSIKQFSCTDCLKDLI